MPNPSDYQDKNEFMKVCIPKLKEEGKEQDQAVAVCISMWDRRGKQPASNISHIFSNGYRMEMKGGKEFIVVPGVPLREGVMNTYLMPASTIQKSLDKWNGTAISIGHPKLNGGSVQVPNPDVAIIGNFYNPNWDESRKRMTGEYWIDMAEAMKHAQGRNIIDGIKGNKVLETSTGYWADELAIAGNFAGRDYATIHDNILSDHIAILTDAIGACSIRDGCGVNLNQVIHNCECDCPFKNAGVSYQKDHLPREMLEGYALNKGVRTPEQLEGLRAHLKEKGIDKPVYVMRKRDGTISILDGNHRVAMAGEYGIDQIPVNAVNEDLQPIDPEVMFIEWMHGRDQGYINVQQREQAPALENFKSYKGVSMDIKGLIDALTKRGVKVTANENLQEFEVEEPTTPGPHQPEALTADEIAALKGFAALASKLNGIGPDALIQNLTHLKDLPEALRMAQNYQRQEEQDKAVMVANILANPANILSEEELKGMSTSVLTKLNAQSTVNYAGMGGAQSIFANEEDVLLPAYLREEASS